MPNPIPPARRPTPFERALNFLRRFTTPQRRSEFLTGLRFPGQQIQYATFTVENRYRVLFHQCALLLAAEPHPRVLSFGCSTGEEAFALAASLPHAEVVGVDINRWCLRQATSQNRDSRIHFAHSLAPGFTASPPFHAIFCMAVLQDVRHRTDDVRHIRRGLTFARFEQELLNLDAKLLPGGYLFLDNCDFRFADTVLAGRYEVVTFPGSRKVRRRPLFSRSNRRLASEHVADRCFRKLS